MQQAAQIARIAMWIMILAIVLTFFVKGTWVKIIWAVAAGVCLIAILIVVFSRNRNSRR